MLVVVAVAGLALTASTAWAGEARLFTGTFGGSASTVPNPYPFSTSQGPPFSAAVDEATHDVYVADKGNHRVEKFDASGHFLFMVGWKVNRSAVEAGRLGEEDVCPAPGHPADECQAGSAGNVPGAFASTGIHRGTIEWMFLAVDNSGVPGEQGDLYVSDPANELVTKFDSAGAVVSSWGDNGPGESPNGQLARAGGGPFNMLRGIAVSQNGELLAQDVVQQPDRAFIRITRMSSGGIEKGSLLLAAGAEDMYGAAPSGNVFTCCTSEAREYNGSTGAFIGTLNVRHVFFPRGLGIESDNGDVFVSASAVDVGEEARVVRYDSSCHPDNTVGCVPAETFGGGHLVQPDQIAVDSALTSVPVYVVDQTGFVAEFALRTVPDVVTAGPSNISTGAATLNGTIDPSGVELLSGAEGCRFEWGLAETPFEHVVPCSESAGEIGSGQEPVAVHADVTGVIAGQRYHYRLVGANGNQVNGLIDEPTTGQTLDFGPPGIDYLSVRDVSSTAANVVATLRPNNVPTKFHFVYGPEGGANVSTPTSSAGSGAGAEVRSQQLDGLMPKTLYHYRVVAESIFGTVESEDLTFTTQPEAQFSLLDNRAWELVSPPDKRGALLKPISEAGVAEAAADGSGITYLASNPTEADPQGYSNQVQVLSERGPAGWVSRDLAVPHALPTGLSIGVGQEYRAFSEDLSLGAVHPFGRFDPSLWPQSTEGTTFLRANFPSDEAGGICVTGCYRPMVTGAEGVANVPPGTAFGVHEPGEACEKGFCGPEIRGATPNLRRVVLESFVGLSGAPGDNGGLYEWSADAPAGESLELLSILPDGTPAVDAPNNSPSLGFDNQIARNAISTDGSRVIWTDGSGRLYLRDTTRAETIRLDAVHGGANGKGKAAPVFQAASRDGSRVFFTDEQVLTPGAGAEAGKADLYECRIEESEGELECALTDLTPKTNGEAAGVTGDVLGASEDGSYLYFVARSALTPSATPVTCGISESDRCNLYLAHDGSVAFIAALSGSDRPSWGSSTGNGLPSLTARVSPDGRWLAFMSLRPLTGYDNHDAVSGVPDEEVFLYHAEAGGKLVCASCNPTGGRPHGVEFEQIDAGSGHLAGGDRVWPNTAWLAANIPGWTPYVSGLALYQARYLSDAGRLFFNSADALAPKDSNRNQDVYEYEPPAVEAGATDNCTSQNPAFVPRAGGCLGLVSSGTSGEESALLDASESGDDVFFLSAASLTPRDVDSAIDVYDARVGGGEAQPVQPVQCEGDGCQQPATPPVDSTPGSLTFNGAGNVLECPKGKVVKNDKCVAKKSKKTKHHKKQAHKKQKRASSRHGGHK